MKKFYCKHCDSMDLRIIFKGGNNLLYCNDCGKYIQDLNKDDLQLAQMHIDRYDSKSYLNN